MVALRGSEGVFRWPAGRAKKGARRTVEHLPAAVNHILLQADLTAVAPGYLAPELSERLLRMSDAEGQGPASSALRMEEAEKR